MVSKETVSGLKLIKAQVWVVGGGWGQGCTWWRLNLCHLAMGTAPLLEAG